MTFNAKNLTYDKSEPAFLQRLKASYAGQDGRNNVQHARSGKSRLKMGDGEDDDGPVILDESGEIVEKNVYEGMLKGENHESQPSGGAKPKTKDGDNDEAREGSVNDENKPEVDREGQKVVEIGAAKKRKAVKIIGGADDNGKEEEKEEEEEEQEPSLTKNEKKTRPEKSKKKVKKIKLSFDDPE